MAGKVVVVSEKPWSDYTAADYSPEQWHAACLIHQHDGAPTSKGQCKLPVRTPTGTVNRNGVHAAAAALAGARGGVDASDAEKAAAAKALLGLYAKLDEEPPVSLKHSFMDSFLAHVGVKGMKWGVHRKRDDGSAVSKTGDGVKKSGSDGDGEAKDIHVSADAERFIKTRQKEGHEMSDREIKEALNRARMVKEYDEMFASSPNKDLKEKVDALKLKKEYGQLKAEMNPSKVERVKRMISGAESAYDAYQKLDGLTGGALSGQFKGAFDTSMHVPSGSKKKAGPFQVNPDKVRFNNPNPPKKSASILGGP